MYNLASFDMGKFLLKEQQKPIFTILPTPSRSKKIPYKWLHYKLNLHIYKEAIMTARA